MSSDATQARPWLSVIIPTFNGEGTIAEALASVSAQSDPDIEVVVIDDGSTDATLEIVGSYEHLLNLTILQREHTGNWVTNTNHGIEVAAGVYLSILHQDDRWEPKRAATVREALVQNPGAKMCLHPSFFIGPVSTVVGLWRCPFGRRGGTKVIPPDIFLQRLLVQNFIAIPAPVFARADAVKVGLLDESLIYTADWDFWLKMASLGSIAYIPEPLTSFRVHAQSQTTKLSRSAARMEEQLLCVLRRHFDRYQACARTRQSLFRIASFSVKTNVALMKLANAQSVQWMRLFLAFAALGPYGWHQFFHCSRIVDRALARLRVRKYARAVGGLAHVDGETRGCV